MKKRNDSCPIIRYCCRLVARIIQVFGIYVILHGHYSPGGGFQGGALLAVGVILLRIAEGRDATRREMPPESVILIGTIGIFIYAAIGLSTILAGGNFLEYGSLPLPGLDSADRHYWGILVIEIGVGLAVMATLVGIFDSLVHKEENA